MKKVEGSWMDSKFSSAISYFKGKSIQTKQTISELLGAVDNLGLQTAVLNNTCDAYVHGQNVLVHLENVPNNVCLRELEDWARVFDISEEERARLTKQTSNEWHAIRDKAHVTGSTMYRALGLSTLKDQQNHHSKIFHGKTAEVS
jgi:hypothetical protein